MIASAETVYCLAALGYVKQCGRSVLRSTS